MKPSDYIKKGWTQGAFARDRGGVPLSSLSSDAVSWCCSAAIRIAFINASDYGIESRFWRRVQALIPKRIPHVSVWNDGLKSSRRVIQVLEQVEQELGIE